MNPEIRPLGSVAELEVVPAGYYVIPSLQKISPREYSAYRDQWYDDIEVDHIAMVGPRHTVHLECVESAKKRRVDGEWIITAWDINPAAAKKRDDELYAQERRANAAQAEAAKKTLDALGIGA